MNIFATLLLILSICSCTIGQKIATNSALAFCQQQTCSKELYGNDLAGRDECLKKCELKNR